MNTTPKLKRYGWQTFVFGLEAFLVLASLFFVLLIAGFIKTSGSTAGYVVWGYIIAIISLFIAGGVFISHRQPKWGWTALAFAGSAAVLFAILLPILARARTH
jgi:hypothetical protein